MTTKFAGYRTHRDRLVSSIEDADFQLVRIDGKLHRIAHNNRVPGSAF